MLVPIQFQVVFAFVVKRVELLENGGQLGLTVGPVHFLVDKLHFGVGGDVEALRRNQKQVSLQLALFVHNLDLANDQLQELIQLLHSEQSERGLLVLRLGEDLHVEFDLFADGGVQEQQFVALEQDFDE